MAKNKFGQCFDQMERELMQQALAPGVTEVSTEGLPTGIYFWEVTAVGQHQTAASRVRVKRGKVIKISE